MKRLLPVLLPLLLTGCLKGEPQAVGPVADRVYTVEEFLAQPLLRKDVSAVCSSDPGRIGRDPNCINVRRADRIASAGSSADFPKIVP